MKMEDLKNRDIHLTKRYTMDSDFKEMKEEYKLHRKIMEQRQRIEELKHNNTKSDNNKKQEIDPIIKGLQLITKFVIQNKDEVSDVMASIFKSDFLDDKEDIKTAIIDTIDKVDNLVEKKS